MYHRGGVLADEMRWEHGEQVGLETDYDELGRPIAEGRFEAGRPVGTWRCLDPAGSSREIPAPRRRRTPREACGHPSLPELDGD